MMFTLVVKAKISLNKGFNVLISLVNQNF